MYSIISVWNTNDEMLHRSRYSCSKKKKYAGAIMLSKIEVQFLLFKTSSTKYKSFGHLLVQ